MKSKHFRFLRSWFAPVGFGAFGIGAFIVGCTSETQTDCLNANSQEPACQLPDAVNLPTEHKVGGSVEGLKGTVTLQNNGIEPFQVSANGAFNFKSGLSNGSNYLITISKNPSGQICTVENGKGKVQSAAVTTIKVKCKDTQGPFELGGNLSGLDGTLVLKSGTQQVSLTANGTFVFPSKIEEGTAYSIEVVSKPASQICSISAGSGTMPPANVSTVAVVCSSSSVTISGAVSGLGASLLFVRGVFLKNNASDEIEVTQNGSFSFPVAVASGAAYAVTVSENPNGKNCSIANGSGTAGAQNITNVTVTCQNSFSISGQFTVYDGGTIVLQNNGADDLTKTGVGLTGISFNFGSQLSGTAYAITVLTQPADYVCDVSNGSGTVSNTNITDISVVCRPTKRVFATSAGFDGNLGGVVGADAKCMADTNKPAGPANYKAMIVVSSVRQACSTAGCAATENIDWVFRPYTRYVRTDGTTPIAIADTSGRLPIPLTNSFFSSNLGTNNFYLTGLNRDWTFSSNKHCSDWTSSTAGAPFAKIGNGTYVDLSSISAGDGDCSSTTAGLLCVEQN